MRISPNERACVESLQPLEAPCTTELLVAHGANWTAYVNNSIHGGDPWPPTSHLGDELGVRWVVAESSSAHRSGVRVRTTSARA